MPGLYIWTVAAAVLAAHGAPPNCLLKQPAMPPSVGPEAGRGGVQWGGAWTMAGTAAAGT
jgi:hypothetical protein